MTCRGECLQTAPGTAYELGRHAPNCADNPERCAHPIITNGRCSKCHAQATEPSLDMRIAEFRAWAAGWIAHCSQEQGAECSPGSTMSTVKTSLAGQKWALERALAFLDGEFTGYIPRH